MSSPNVTFVSSSPSWYARFWDPMSWVPTIAYLLDWDVMDTTMDYQGFGRRVEYEDELEAEEQRLAALARASNSAPVPSSSQGLVPPVSSSGSGPGPVINTTSSLPASIPTVIVSGPSSSVSTLAAPIAPGVQASSLLSTSASSSSVPPPPSTHLVLVDGASSSGPAFLPSSSSPSSSIVSAPPAPISSGVEAKAPPPSSPSVSSPVSSAVTALPPAIASGVEANAPPPPSSSPATGTVSPPVSSVPETVAPSPPSPSTSHAPSNPPISSGVRALASPPPSSSSTPLVSSSQAPPITDADDLADLFRGVRLDKKGKGKGKGKEKIGGIAKKTAAPKKMVPEVVPTRSLPSMSYQNQAQRKADRQKMANERRKQYYEAEVAKEKEDLEKEKKEIEKYGGVAPERSSIAQIQAELAAESGDADPNKWLESEKPEDDDDDYDPAEEMRRLRAEYALW